MLKIYSGVALILALDVGIAATFLTKVHETDVNCASHTVICAGGTGYYWTSALVLAIAVFVLLLHVGYPIIIAGRIGKPRNRRGYLAGIFFGWAGLIYIMVRKPRTGGPDLMARAVADYRGSGTPAGEKQQSTAASYLS
jgi:hypothetical protein